ncbi:autophagy protein 17 [Arachnomyces sp. PD_36]|nr:autophagy protein 17 [Arachnomyces sp. PD_36]
MAQSSSSASSSCVSSSSSGQPDSSHPNASTHAAQKLQLEDLVSYLVASKRSLSSINHVWRANEIVTTARSALEQSVIVSARSSFLCRGLNEQLRLLYGVRAEVEEISRRGRAEFENALKDLDAADFQLKETLTLLDGAVVEAAFRPADEEPKSLRDFVDERGVEDLQSSLKGAIDNTNNAQRELHDSNHAFDHALRSIQHALAKYRMATKLSSSHSSTSLSVLSSPSSSHIVMPSPSPIPSLLRSLESDAQEMADLLESLVRHFDLCVTAIKHTEGGGAAAQRITGDLPTGVHVDITNLAGNDGNDDGTTDNQPLEPISDEEYDEMLNVLIKDAAEAEDVVLEIQDRIANMESNLDHVLGQRDSLISSCDATTNIFHRLSSLSSTHLPDYIANAHKFMRVWNDEHESIRQGMAELSDLRALYTGFLEAYDGLILEVARRKAVRQEVERVLHQTRDRLDSLFEEDAHAREAFRVEQGDYLPSDIWPGLGRGPMKVEFLRLPSGNLENALAAPSMKQKPIAEGGGDTTATGSAAPGGDTDAEDGDNIPDISKHVVQDALRRVRGRAKDHIG